MKKVQGHDSFQRINFLYQIGKDMAGKYPILSAYYGNLILNVAKKQVMKIHPDLKRQICKKCHCLLVNGKSANVQLKNNKKHKYLRWTCKTCKMAKDYPSNKNKDHRVWLEKPEAVEETIS